MRISLLLSILLLLVNILSDIYIIRQIPKRIKTKLFNISVWGVNTIIYALFVVFVCMVYMKNFQFFQSEIALSSKFSMHLSLISTSCHTSYPGSIRRYVR